MADRVADATSAPTSRSKRIAVAEAVNHFMLAVTSLHEDTTDTASILHRPRSRERDLLLSRQDPTCLACSPNGSLGHGDR